MSNLLDLAQAWAAEDPDPETRAELLDLVRRVEDPLAAAELADRFAGTLEFGTAGMRGPLGAGPNRMNRVVVSRAAAGLAAYLGKHGGGSVVIGYDARRKSDVFARDTAEVMQGAGIEAMVLPAALPTPVLAFAIRRLGCAAGVMVTASHNPAQDNGYKVYLDDGAQIGPPTDAEISGEIAAVGALAEVPRGDGWTRLGDQVLSSYLAATSALVESRGPKDVVTVYTPLHGVGGEVVAETMRLAGFPAAHRVAEQFDPDGAFPTVSFPNPEEPGTLDLAMSLAAQVGADLVVANDPDADRVAVAVPGPHGWRMLSGDEVGALLADFLLRTRIEGTYACSIVSSSLLGRMAQAHGQPYAETLTGFKWISHVPGLVFGYEEALGYCVAPDQVRDKDGISALIRIVELAALLKAAGQTLQERLDEIAATYGVHATDQLSVRVTDLPLIAEAMAKLRSAPPTILGGLRVEQVDDLRQGSSVLPATDGLRYRLGLSARVIVRPSGTEPKLKCYLEVVVPATDGVDAARIAAVGRLDAIRTDLVRAIGLRL